MADKKNNRRNNRNNNDDDFNPKIRWQCIWLMQYNSVMLNLHFYVKCGIIISNVTICITPLHH